jgi:DNA-binding transcriptional regulator YiaG
MPNVAQVLREEISRLARKEIRTTCDPLRKQVQTLRRTVRSQQTKIDRLERSLSKMVQQTASGTGTGLYAPAEEAEQTTRARVTPASIRRHRHRLGLSQADLGGLLSVSTNTIVRWEQGTSTPRAQHRTALLRLRDLGRRDIKKILEE